MVVSTYAVFLAGASWVPIDPEVPFERKLELVKDSKAALLVCQAGLSDSVAGLECRSAEIALDGSQLSVDGDAAKASSSELPSVSLADPAIILYTSGTTGKPKGIIYSHQHVNHGSNTLADLCEITSSSTCFLKTPFIWAVVEWELFPALVRGGKLVVGTAMGHKDPVYLCDTVASEGVTVLVMAPKVLDLLYDVHSTAGQLRGLKHVVAVGEGFPISLAQRCNSLRNFSAQVHNVYGASESSATVWTVPRCGVDTRVWNGKMSPVGRPQPGCSVWILDKERKRVPTGCTGEIVFGGQLADGYWNLPETTAEKFVNTTEFGRVYLSGDLGRWKAGEIEIVGRADRQVKIRGVRVEPEEIEATIKGFTRTVGDDTGLLEAGARGLTGVGVVATSEPADLVAFVSPSLTVPEMEDLKAHCKNNLPPYYVPKYFKSMDALPTLANGKVNLRALVDLANQHVSEGTEMVQDSLGQMRNMSKSAMLENEVLHRCYTVWLFGVLTDHWNNCGMAPFPYSCGTLSPPTVTKLPAWVELFVRQIGNDQDMFGFILFGALQDSRPEAGQQAPKKVRLGYPDMFLFLVYLFAGFPIPQILHAIMPSVINEECASAWPADGCSGHRWYLLMTVWVHVFLALCQLLRIWPSIQVLAHGLLAVFGPTYALDLCSTNTPTWFKWTNAWIWGLRSTEIGQAGDTCPIYWGWFQIYVFYYVGAYFYCRPCMVLIKKALARVNGPYWAIGAGAASVVLGATMAAFHYPNISTEYGVHDSRFRWWDLPLEIGADAVQPVLLALAMAWCPLNMAWWGNSTLGTYVFHFYIRTQMYTNWMPAIMRQMETIPGGVVQLFVVLAIPFVFVTFIGPIGHYLLLTPGFIMNWAQRRFARGKPTK
jgi:amino acid adenylation domain-containing protein